MAEVTMDLAPFKGLDWYSYPGLMKDGYSPDCANVEFDAGIIKSTKGYNRLENKQNCRHLHIHYKNDGNTVWLLFANGNIENYRTGEVIKSGYYLDSDTLSMVNYQLNDTYITVICNGRTAPVKFDGTSISNLGGNPPKAAYVDLHNERLFMAGDTNHPDRVYYSASFNPESWSIAVESGYIDLPSWDGGKIQEIKSMFGDLVVFKDFGLYRIYGTYPGEFGVEKINSNVGCSNRNTITFNGITCYFHNKLGLCVYNGMSAQLINEPKIKAVFDKIEPTRAQHVTMFDYGGKLYVYLPVSTGPDSMIEYDYGTGVIVRKQGVRAWQFFETKDYLGIIDQYKAVCRYNYTERYDGDVIDHHWTSRTYDGGSKGVNKTIFQMSFSGKGKGSVNIIIKTDRGSFTSAVQLSDTYEYYQMPLRALGRWFIVEISANQAFEMDSPKLYLDIEEE